MYPHFNTGSVTNTHLCHPASMISTCCTTHSKCWLKWPWFDKTGKTGAVCSVPISTPPRNVRTIEGWQTPHRTTDDNTFYSEGEPRRVYWVISRNETFDSNEPRHVSSESSPSSTPPPPPRQKRKLSRGMSFLQKGGVSQHTCEACGQRLQAEKKPYCSGRKSNFKTVN